MASNVRQNYHPDCEQGVNDYIQLELEAMYAYISMANYFDRHDQALQGFSSYFTKAAQKKMDQIGTLSTYQNKRGGKVVYKDLKKPEKSNWDSALEVMQGALDMERTGNEALISLRKVADTHNDAAFGDFLEDEFLQDRVSTIKEMAEHVTNIQRVQPGHGVYHFDKDLN